MIAACELLTRVLAVLGAGTAFAVTVYAMAWAYSRVQDRQKGDRT